MDTLQNRSDSQVTRQWVSDFKSRDSARVSSHLALSIFSFVGAVRCGYFLLYCCSQRLLHLCSRKTQKVVFGARNSNSRQVVTTGTLCNELLTVPPSQSDVARLRKIVINRHVEDAHKYVNN